MLMSDTLVDGWNAVLGAIGWVVLAGATYAAAQSSMSGTLLNPFYGSVLPTGGKLKDGSGMGVCC